MKKQINPTIKAHLIRSAFYLLLLLAVCAIPFALAQRNAAKQSMNKPATPSNSLTPLSKLKPASKPGTAEQKTPVKKKGVPLSAGAAPRQLSGPVSKFLKSPAAGRLARSCCAFCRSRKLRRWCCMINTTTLRPQPPIHRSSRTSLRLATLLLMTLSCLEDRLGLCSRSTPTEFLLIFPDLASPTISMSSSTPTARAFLVRRSIRPPPRRL